MDSFVGRSITGLPTPALLIDLDVLEANIRTMGQLAADAGIAYRPHAKSHKQPLIAYQQIAAGAVGVCCTKLSEALVMLDAGVGDLLITSPVVTPWKIALLAKRAREARIGVVVDSLRNVQALGTACADAGSRLDVLVEIDVGQKRCGVAPDKASDIAIEVDRTPGLRFAGLQGYQGLLQLDADAERRLLGAKTANAILQDAAERVRRAGLPVDTLTGGGTGTIQIDIGMGGLNELQPGSYVFMDSRYASVDWGDGPIPFACSLFVLAGVVSTPMPGRAILDAGWKAISNDGGNPVPLDVRDARFRFAGDEHCALESDGPLGLSAGDCVRLRPSHCDTTINLYDHCFAFRGGEVVACWPIPGRGKTW
jgi:D-serine deaminase-like pyridoxal phosphate-dependent protein